MNEQLIHTCLKNHFNSNKMAIRILATFSGFKIIVFLAHKLVVTNNPSCLALEMTLNEC